MPTPVDHDIYRRLLSCFATGVTVITTRDPDDCPVGMTASAVSAVSLDPPLILVCVDHGADFHSALSESAAFVVNILASDQGDLARRFATRETDKFSGVAYTTHPTGQPVLDGLVAYIVCERWDALEAGDHTVFLGRVAGGESSNRAPLLYFRGGYGSLDS